MARVTGFRETVGYDVQIWREGYAEIFLDLGQGHKNRMGIVHGGVYMTILDAAMGHAATFCTVPEQRQRCVTLSMTTSFMSPAKEGRIIAIGHLEGVHERVAHCRGEIVDKNGKLLMAAQAAFRYLPGEEGQPRG